MTTERAAVMQTERLDNFHKQTSQWIRHAERLFRQIEIDVEAESEDADYWRHAANCLMLSFFEMYKNTNEEVNRLEDSMSPRPMDSYPFQEPPTEPPPSKKHKSDPVEPSATHVAAAEPEPAT